MTLIWASALDFSLVNPREGIDSRKRRKRDKILEWTLLFYNILRRRRRKNLLRNIRVTEIKSSKWRLKTYEKWGEGNFKIIMMDRCIFTSITAHLFYQQWLTKKYRSNEWRRECVHLAEKRCLEADWPQLDRRCWFRRPLRQKIR